jgi:predicted RND superfamily exporter protein
LTAFVAAVLSRRRAVQGLYALLVLAMLPGLARLETDNSPEVFFLSGSSSIARYHDFLARFGSDAGVRVVLQGPQLFSAAGLEFLARVESDAARLEGVEGASGPAGHHRRRWPVFPPADPEAFRTLVAGNALDRAAGFVTPSGEALSVLVQFAPGPAESHQTLLTKLERGLADPPPGVSATVVGSAVLDRALNESGRDVQEVYFPLLLGCAALLLLGTFRELSAVVLPLAFVAVVEIVVLGAMGYAGVRFNLVVAILPPILFVIALASAVHLMLRCRDIEADPEDGGHDAISATLATYGDKGRALFWTTLSTFAGFASLAATPVTPIRTLGIWAALGLGFAGFAAFTLFPCLLARTMGRRTSLPERAFERRMQEIGRRVTEFAADRRGPVLAVYAALALFAALGLPRLSVASNALHYLAADHPARIRIEAVERLGIGLSSLEIVATLAPEPAGGAAGFLGKARLAQLARLVERLRREPGVLSAIAAPDLLDDVARASPLAGAFPLEELRERLAPLVAADESGGRALAHYLAADGSAARLTLFVATEGYTAVEPLRARALALATAELPDATVELTGKYPLLLAMQRYLLSTLALSLLLTLPVLAITFYILLRDAKGTFYALVPNLWPVLVILGGMAWTGVPLDIATVMVASITLGLVVDDTIHTLAHYRTLSARLGKRGAVADRMEKTAPAYLLTGVILACGFGVCALSDFAPTSRFGVLSGIAIVIAVVADFTLVPALFGKSER